MLNDSSLKFPMIGEPVSLKVKEKPQNERKRATCTVAFVRENRHGKKKQSKRRAGWEELIQVDIREFKEGGRLLRRHLLPQGRSPTTSWLQKDLNRGGTRRYERRKFC